MPSLCAALREGSAYARRIEVNFSVEKEMRKIESEVDYQAAEFAIRAALTAAVTDEDGYEMDHGWNIEALRSSRPAADLIANGDWWIVVKCLEPSIVPEVMAGIAAGIRTINAYGLAAPDIEIKQSFDA